MATSHLFVTDWLSRSSISISQSVYLSKIAIGSMKQQPNSQGL